MPNLEIIKEDPLSLVEFKEKIKELKKRDKELISRATKTEEYMQKFAKGTIKKQTKLKEKFENSGISRLKPRHIKKLTDMAPKDMDSLRLLFSGENITFKQEDLNKMLTLLNES